jgi:hypothetical protein
MGNDMKLITEADDIIRNVVPAILESYGGVDEAKRLRHGPRLNNKSAKSMCRLLASIETGDPLRYLTFWTEALIHSAIREDHLSFTMYVSKISTMIAMINYSRKHLN